MQERRIEEDEIDLRELFLTLWAKRSFIIIFTLLVTICAIIYAYMKTPIYETKLVFEVGQNPNNNNGQGYIENPRNLVEKLKIEYITSVEKSTIKSIKVVKGTSNMIEITAQTISNQQGKKELKAIFETIKKDHDKKINDYKKLLELNLSNMRKQIVRLDNEKNNFEGKLVSKYNLMSKIDGIKLQLSPLNIKNTHIIGNIIQKDYPIKPKKKLIVVVAFVTGFILSIFIVFFMQFINGFKEEREEK